MRGVLLVDTGEQNVALAVCVRMVQGPRSGAEDGMLAARRGRLSEASAAEKEVPRRVERRARVRGDMSRVRAQCRGGISRGLGGERRALSGGEIVVEFKSAHVRRVNEAVLR